MPNNSSLNQDKIVNIVDLYLSKWKVILVSLIFFLSLGYLLIRYSQYEYLAKATIKIKEDEKSNKLSELSAMQNYGMFSSTFTNVNDEVEVIKSRSIMAQVVEDLKLNLQFYNKGRVKGEEAFVKKPLNINFLVNDSILHAIDTSLYIKIVSPEKFELTKVNNNKIIEISSEDKKTYAFGDRIKSRFGDFIITPNYENNGPTLDTYIEIRFTPFDKVVEAYIEKLKIETNPKSNVIKLSIAETSKEKAVIVLNKIIEKYNKDVIEDKELIVQTTSDFINNRLEIVSSELENVDFTAENLQKNNRLTALASQSNIYLQSEKENEVKIITTANQLQLVDFMKDHLAENNKNSDLLPADVGIADNGISQLTKSHNELVLQRNRILKNSSEKNPTVVNLNNQIQALKENLAMSLENIKSTNKITLEALNQEDARISSQLFSAPTKERQFRDIKRQQDIKESLYLYLLQKREESAISLGMKVSNSKVVDSAYSQDLPINPKPKIIYLAAFIIGLFGPLSIIYVTDLLDTKIHSKDDVLKLLSAPYIGDIPKSSSKDRLIKKVDYSPKAEAFRIIRTNIGFLLKDNDNPCKTIFVTSTTSQEGKSHTSINLAASFSFSEKKVLLIETDIRIPRVNDYLNIERKDGLTDYISDKTKGLSDVTIQVENNPFFHIIPSGTIPPNPAEILMSERVDELFKKVKKEYDYVIVDTAAVGLVTDTLLISKFADMFLYVVSANNIDKRQLHIAQTMYTEKRLPNMTVLLNGTEQKKGYGYGYGNNPNKKKSWIKRLVS